MNPPAEQYEPDDLVTHGKYGLGRVILVEGDAAVVVGFAPGKVRIIGAVHQDDQALTVAAGSTRAGSAPAAALIPR